MYLMIHAAHPHRVSGFFIDATSSGRSTSLQHFDF
jgi:hypothetical protein